MMTGFKYALPLRRYLDMPIIKAMLLVGIAYYLAALIAIHQTITPEGIAILWPPNAILLSAFLIYSHRYLPFIAVAGIIAELIAATPSFPFWYAVYFALINICSVAFAAFCIRRKTGQNFNFNRLKDGAYFLVFGPFLSACIAGMLGGAVYVSLGRTDTSYMSLWQIWWFGDALAMLVFTPLIVVLARWKQAGFPHFKLHFLLEAVLLWLVVIIIGYQSLNIERYDSSYLFFTPIWLVFLGIVAAIRLGVAGASSTVALITVFAVEHLLRGTHPLIVNSPQDAVLLTQEYLAIIAIVSIGLALLIQEIAEQRDELKRHENALKAQNLFLEERVNERTLALKEVNQALQQANDQLAKSAATDELTGIANRRHFLSEVARELKRLRLDGQTASAIMIDIDHFKMVNDNLGHDAGDKVLREIVEPISQAIRPRDLFGRMGGEEFLIFLSGADYDTSNAVAERIRVAIESLNIRYREHEINITVSLGVAQWDGNSHLDELFYQADKALYQAKNRGRNRVYNLADAEIHPISKSDHEIHRELP
ncbi:diguanylate cyclase [Methylophaga sp.]|uniref:sensor domain-containing diguanylate cyclase n=1 Tax=Methylophaga sp. TaxID=2024840 RepID=UPI002721F16A|nr:diguanylate cyclase [Methylophaga sp.]MDO8826244.1 diguanylate cyclase [Methylophaga sp.]